MVTASTYGKERLFDSSDKLKLLHDALLSVADEFHWQLQAWAVFANHYHFVAHSEEPAARVSSMIRKLHATTAIALNKLDDKGGRRVWFQYWDTPLTYQRSYLARLAYVVNNPVKHGLVRCPEEYEWCSARWFRQSAVQSFYRTVMSMRTDAVRVTDDF